MRMYLVAILMCLACVGICIRGGSAAGGADVSLRRALLEPGGWLGGECLPRAVPAGRVAGMAGGAAAVVRRAAVAGSLPAERQPAVPGQHRQSHAGDAIRDRAVAGEDGPAGVDLACGPGARISRSRETVAVRRQRHALDRRQVRLARGLRSLHLRRRAADRDHRRGRTSTPSASRSGPRT